tara:strand:+ start:2915 stop:3673 length:759 start_codon:yes stop_codon:yes gene_type:complete
MTGKRSKLDFDATTEPALERQKTNIPKKLKEPLKKLISEKSALQPETFNKGPKVEDEIAMIIPCDVIPKKSSLTFSWPCEIKAAKIRNQTLSKMRKGDIGNVAYFLLKNKRGLARVRNELKMLSLLLVYILYSIFNRIDTSQSIAASNLPGIGITGYAFYAMVAADLGNELRYRETINDCGKWLAQNINSKALNIIEKLNYNEHHELHKILTQNNLEATLLFTDPHNPVKREIISSPSRRRSDLATLSRTKN